MRECKVKCDACDKEMSSLSKQTANEQLRLASIHAALVACVVELESSIAHCAGDLCAFPKCACHDDTKKALAELERVCGEPK